MTNKNKKLVIKYTRKYGKGVFAGEDVKKGEVVRELSGERMTIDDFIRKVNSGKENIDDPLQIGRRTYLDYDELSRTINHSCDPNCGVRKVTELFALRDIKKGDEITYDYSSVIAPTVWQMKCKCGSKNCRKIIKDVLSIPKRQREKYKKLGAFQTYMKVLLKEVDAGIYKTPKYEIRLLESLNKRYEGDTKKK